MLNMPFDSINIPNWCSNIYKCSICYPNKTKQNNFYFRQNMYCTPCYRCWTITFKCQIGFFHLCALFFFKPSSLPCPYDRVPVLKAQSGGLSSIQWSETVLQAGSVSLSLTCLHPLRCWKARSPELIQVHSICPLSVVEVSLSLKQPNQTNRSFLRMPLASNASCS